VHDDGGGAEEAVDVGFGPADVADILKRYLIGAAGRLAHEPEISEVVPLT